MLAFQCVFMQFCIIPAYTASAAEMLAELKVNDCSTFFGFKGKIPIFHYNINLTTNQKIC